MLLRFFVVSCILLTLLIYFSLATFVTFILSLSLLEGGSEGPRGPLRGHLQRHISKRVVKAIWPGVLLS